MKQWWKDYAYTLATRVNTFTGVPYRDEPAILAWEIGNEMRCSSCAGTTKLPDAIAELATFLKQVAPNQLIADGGDGFDDDPTPYVGLSNYYAVRGDEGASFSKLGTGRGARPAELPLLPAQLRLLDRARHRDLDRAPPGDRGADRQGRLSGRVRLRRPRPGARPDATTAGCATCSRSRTASSACSGSSRPPPAPTTTASPSTPAATAPPP